LETHFPTFEELQKYLSNNKIEFDNLFKRNKRELPRRRSDSWDRSHSPKAMNLILILIIHHQKISRIKHLQRHQIILSPFITDIIEGFHSDIHEEKEFDD
jgi:hypothetical protein